MRTDYYAHAKVIGTIFAANQAEAGAGGGLGVTSQSLPLIANSVFVGNSAPEGGAIKNEDSSHASYINITVAHNRISGGTDNHGGAMDNFDSNPKLQNSLFWDNQSNASLQELHNSGTSSPTVQDSATSAAYSGNNACTGDCTPALLDLSEAPFTSYPDASSGTWSDAASYNAAAIQTTLTATGTPFGSNNSLVGQFVRPNFATGQHYPIVANTVNSLTIWGYVGVNPGQAYGIYDLRLKPTDSGFTNQCLEAGALAHLEQFNFDGQNGNEDVNYDLDGNGESDDLNRDVQGNPRQIDIDSDGTMNVDIGAYERQP